MKIITIDMLSDRMKTHYKCSECCGHKFTYLMSYVDVTMFNGNGCLWLCKGCLDKGSLELTKASKMGKIKEN